MDAYTVAFLESIVSFLESCVKSTKAYGDRDICGSAMPVANKSCATPLCYTSLLSAGTSMRIVGETVLQTLMVPQCGL